MNFKTICISSGLLLLLGIPAFWPYGYYVFLRWAVCFVSIYVAYKFYYSKQNGWALVFSALAFLFNPIFPLYLSKGGWIPVDLIGSTLFFIAAYSNNKNVKA
jgi:hypothetical protein